MITPIEIIIRLLLGAVFGGIIGFERHAHGRAAGFRTHLLVCVASVLVMIVSEYYHFLTLWDPSYVRADPGRIAAGAITGVGFIGAGVIVKMGFNVQGLTTAACLWIVSVIGLSIGSGLYVAGMGGFVITYIALWLLRMVEDKMPGLSYRFMTVVMEGHGDEEAITSVLRDNNSAVNRINYLRDLETMESSFEITFTFRNGVPVKKILDEISSIGKVKRVSIRG